MPCVQDCQARAEGHRRGSDRDVEVFDYHPQVPARLLRWGHARAAARDGWSSDPFAWLARYQPVTVIGDSIFVYDIR